MKTPQVLYCTLFSLFLLNLSQKSTAQVAFTLHGTGVTSTLDDAKVKPGVGVAAKMYFSPRVALGVSAKYLGLAYDEHQSLGVNLRNKGSIVPLTGMFEYYLTDGFIRPYLGVEAGAYLRTVKVDFQGEQVAKQKDTRFGAAPKAGVALSFGGIGVFAEGSYHLLFGNKNGSTTIGSANNINWQNPNRLWAVNVGLTFGFPRTNE